MTAPGDPGTIYLLHLDPAYRHARHYTGWTRDLAARLEAHRAGQGARLMEVVKAAGGSFRLARTWAGGRDRERAIKNRHEAPKLCPVCSPEPRPVQAGKSAGRPEPVRPAVTLPPPEATPAQAATAPRPQASMSGPEAWPWPGRPVSISAAGPEIDGVVDALIDSWRFPKAEAGPGAEAAGPGARAAQPTPPLVAPENVPQRELELGA
jgi:predicted GIY-YIG superfamily endonuclease